ncbi:hypothetical protein B7P43_G04435 [Cryptotermes secundus]|uniref:FAM21/CAPZIP domain-containing protein n=1 Tax=Cryptotermes secundus TaxID=105785 RepID=A0A2J7QJT4_9NEOP|nr:hypothetical protein B7P43_G04435 [Cryptotermes secundus]
MMRNIGDVKEDSEDPVKSWERPWNTDEMRQQSAGWNLAGDAGLLRHLQQFSQNLLSQTHVMEVTLDSLMEQLRATSTDVSNVTSQFLCLSDTQFLENRVYDDDNDDDDDKEEEKKEEMPSEEKEEEQPKSKEEQEAEVVTRIHEALALGVSVLDNMFDSVEVPASDSEDEESGGRLVLEPRNPYLSRALPYLIGCRQFMEDDYVGLGSLSDSEEDGVNKNLILSSDSESEMDIEHKNMSKKRMRTSVSAGESSETDTEEGPAPGKQKKAEDDTIAATNTAQSDMFGGDSPTEDVGVGGIHDNFAAELAQKLGVAAAEGVSEQRAEGNKHTVKWDGGDGNDLFRQRDGKFSGGQGLFDDLEDSSGSLWGSKDKLTIDKGVENPTEAWLFGPGTGSENGTEKTKRLLSVAARGVATSTPETQTDDLGLFIDSDISNIKNSPQLDGDLCTAPKQPPRNPGQVIVDQQPVSNKKKKPAGAVSIFGSVDVFKAGIRKPPSCSSCSSDGSECTGDTSSGIGQTRSEHQDSTKSPGTSAAASGSKISLFDPSAVLNKAITSSYLFQDETVGDDDSLFSNSQKGIAPSSDKSANGGGPISSVGAASQKHISLFSDSDSGDDDILFSSTSSASSRSRRSQGSGDLLAASGEKGRSAAVPKTGPVDNEDLFGGTKDGPVFDIFSTVVNTVGKPEGIEDGNKDLFSGQLDDPEYNLFGPSDTFTSGTTVEEKLKHNGKDMLFGVGGGDKYFDILGGSGDAESVRTMTQVSVGHNSQSSFKDSNWGLFSNSGTDGLVGDIFAVPVNKSQREPLPSKAMVVDSLFPGGSVLEDSTDNLFASPVKPRKWSQNIMKTDGINGQIDDLFSVPRTVSSTQDANENKVVPKDCTASNSEPVTESQNDVSAAVPDGSSYMVSSSHFSNVMGKSGTDLFNTSTSNLLVNKEPVTSNKPLISPKPKLSPVRKPPLLQVTVGKSDNFPACKMNFDKNISQLSSSTDAKETCDNLSGDAVQSDGQQASTKSGQESEIISSVAENTERLTTKEESVQPSKLEPPRTLNIRKSTGFLFSSSSNEDEDLFGMSLPKEVTLDSDSTEVTDEKPSNNLSAVLQGSSSIVRKLMPFSAERHSESEKEMSSKVDSHKVPAECDSSSTLEVWSVGASPRLPNIDPVTLLPGARPSLRENHSVEVAVSFDQPAQFNATLPNAGKDRAKIQAKRRPPSRRARQEAVRTSGIFSEGLDTVDDIQEPGGVSSTRSQPPPSGIVHCPSKPQSSSFVDGSSNLLSPSTDEEDLFGVPQDLPSEYGSNKDDSQSLFSCAPVLSPLEPLAKFPTANNLPKCTAIECPEGDTLHASKVLKDSTVPVSHIPSNENSISVPDFSSSDPDICEIQPPLEVLHDIDTKKTEPLSGTEKQELFGTDSVFSSVKPIPELNASYTIVGKTRHLSDSHQNAHASSKDYLSSEDPLSPDEIPPMSENMQQSQSQEELFGSGCVPKLLQIKKLKKGLM